MNRDSQKPKWTHTHTRYLFSTCQIERYRSDHLGRRYRKQEYYSFPPCTLIHDTYRPRYYYYYRPINRDYIRLINNLGNFVWRIYRVTFAPRRGVTDHFGRCTHTHTHTAYTVYKREYIILVVMGTCGLWVFKELSEMGRAKVIVMLSHREKSVKRKNTSTDGVDSLAGPTA